MKYTATIFDLFGTLVHEPSRKRSQSVLLEMATTLSVPVDDFVKMWAETGAKRNVGIFPNLESNIKYICQEIGVNVNENQVRQAVFLRTERIRHALQPRIGAVGVLSQLRSFDFRTGLISNCSPEVPPLWRETQLAPWMDTTVFSSLEGLRKPDVRIYRLATERLGVKADNCLYIGDGDSRELSGAANAGMHPLMVKVLLEEPSDDPRSETEEWTGPTIESLQGVINLLLSPYSK